MPEATGAATLSRSERVRLNAVSRKSPAAHQNTLRLASGLLCGKHPRHYRRICLRAFGVLVIIVPVLIVGAVASFFLPKSKIVLLGRTRPQASDVIKGEYKVIESSKVERHDDRSI
jgi:hypothetical protein